MAADGGAWRRVGRHTAALLATLVVAAGMPSALAPSAGAAASFVPISGSGSTWSFNALEQWRKNVAGLYGMTINFSPNGSTNGRNDYRNGQVDFAVSEIPYGLTDGGVLDPPPQRGFAYMPIVAGGTAFMYNLKIGNKRVTNLRLSGETITKIFTQKITAWDDPAIKADNPGLALPPRKIIPVVLFQRLGQCCPVHCLDGQPVPRAVGRLLPPQRPLTYALRIHLVLPAGPRHGGQGPVAGCGRVRRPGQQ